MGNCSRDTGYPTCSSTYYNSSSSTKSNKKDTRLHFACERAMKVSGSWQKKIVTDNHKTQLKYPKWFEIKYLTVTMTSVFPVRVEWLPLRCLITKHAFVWPKIYIPEFPSCAILLFPQTANCVWAAEAPALPLGCSLKCKIKKFFCYCVTVVL